MFEDFVPLQMACLTDYTELIPGALDAVHAMRARGLPMLRIPANYYDDLAARFDLDDDLLEAMRRRDEQAALAAFDNLVGATRKSVEAMVS